MSDTESPVSKSAPRWMRMLLFVSLALNLLILGAAAGAFLGGGHDKKKPRSNSVTRELGLGPYMRALQEDDRKALRQAATDRFSEMQAGRQEIRNAFDETLEVLRAEALDEDRLRSLIERQASLADKGRRVGQDLFIERIKAMSLGDRRILATRLEEAVKRGSKHHRGYGGKP